ILAIANAYRGCGVARLLSRSGDAAAPASSCCRAIACLTGVALRTLTISFQSGTGPRSAPAFSCVMDAFPAHGESVRIFSASFSDHWVNGFSSQNAAADRATAITAQKIAEFRSVLIAFQSGGPNPGVPTAPAPWGGVVRPTRSLWRGPCQARASVSP